MKNKKKTILFNIIFLLICITVAYIVSNYMFISIDVSGPSMETTLHNADRIMLFKLDSKYKYGDIIVFNSHKIDAEGKEQYLVKRLIGLPGDDIEIVRDALDGKYYVFRNGEKLIEDYVDDDKMLYAQQERITVAEGQFYYLGDNRSVSQDSRAGYMGKLDDIVGRVILRYKFDLDDFQFEFVKRIK